MPRYDTSTPVMKAKVDLLGHLPDLLSPRHTPETP
ncbi:succinate dehydrogenase iron-sulfur subunit [Cutibacterium phage CAP_10-3]|nr:succinate dehydrogenase iron-sulfur subunit [Cutibacterium phage CAP_10-3]